VLQLLIEGITMLKLPIRPVCFLAFLMLSAPGARAGGDMGGPDEHPEEGGGPSYFGFVKDARGAPIPDAKVTANVKNGVSFITHTTAVGLYRFGAFSNQVNPNDITVSCAKDGYRQTRVLRRPAPKVDPSKPIEIECRMERG
jgi:hypothetical protein